VIEKENVRKAVRDRYAQRARSGGSCCGASESCCGSTDPVSKIVGYTEEQLHRIPEGADLGLGCGNPTALASLREGEVVVDLGSGAGIDCFLAAEAVGPTGRVIGVDMTPQMLDRSRENARRSELDHVEFRLGEIEHLPVADSSVDVILSNCVINLSIDKPQVFREAYRVLKPGGRVFVSDIVLLQELPENVRASVEAYVGCVAGASMKHDYLAHIEGAGFTAIEVLKETTFEPVLSGLSSDPQIVVDGVEVDPETLGLTAETAREIGVSVASITLRAVKP